MAMQSLTLMSSTCALLGTTLLAQPAFAEPDHFDTGAEAPPPEPGAKLTLQIEPGIATALSDPQSQRTDAGFGQTVKVLFGLTRFLEVGPSASFTTLRSSDEMATTTSGTSWAFGGGARLMRPHDEVSLYGVSPWVDADMLYV